MSFGGKLERRKIHKHKEERVKTKGKLKLKSVNLTVKNKGEKGRAMSNTGVRGKREK
jgi:hypothetical protein